MMGKSSGKEGGDGMEKMEGGSHDVVHEYSTTTTYYDDGEQQQRQEVMRMNEEEEICWLEREQQTLLHEHDHHHGGDDDDPSMMFYTDFPPLPAATADDNCCFPCMSSSSSSSSSISRTAMTTSVVSALAPAKSYTSSSATSSSASSAAVSWTVPKQQTERSGVGENEKKRRHYDVVLEDDDDHHHQGDADADAAAGGALLSSSTASMTMELFSAAAQPHEDYGSDDIDCINVVENFGYMDLLDNNDIWDPCSIFQFDNNNNNNINIPEEILQDQKNQDRDQDMSSSHQQQQQQQQQQGEDEEAEEEEEGNMDQLYFLQGNGELAVIFLEWLKQNREYISAEDMRNIKLKRSTIECASKRLGSSKEGKKQLLKLILEWVEQYQLQRKRLKETAAAAALPDDSPSPYPYPYPYAYEPPPPNPDFNSLHQDPNLCFSPSPWLPVSPPVSAPLPIGGGFIPCDAYSNGLPGPAPPPSNQIMNGNIYHQLQPQPTDSSSSPGWNAQPTFAMMQPPPPNQYTFPGDNYSGFPNSHQALYGNPNPYQYHQVFDGTGVGVGERLVRLGSSATKEARKKRMARQRRLNIHQHRHHNQNQNQNQTHQQQQSDQQRQHGGGSVENCSSNNNNNNSQTNANSWVYWSPTSAVPPSSSPLPFVDAPNSHAINNPPDRSHQMQQQQNQHRLQSSSDRRQGYKTEKNLKFLLQKVLKQSDVGNLGRIVLPKKEAETHLPELESRDGIPIAMEDIGTSNVWNMRYRFWPNNKSRMYLLENTGDFVRVNGLQEGDFIVIYSDTKCGKYLIRGVKVRQPGSKSEGKKPARRNMRNLTQAGGAQTFSQLAHLKQTVK